MQDFLILCSDSIDEAVNEASRRFDVPSEYLDIQSLDAKDDLYDNPREKRYCLKISVNLNKFMAEKLVEIEQTLDEDSSESSPSQTPAQSSNNGRAEIHISDDGMSVYLDVYPPTGDGKNVSGNIIFKKLKRLGVCFGLKTQEIIDALRLAAHEGKIARNICIAEGKQPVNPSDGGFEFAFDDVSSLAGGSASDVSAGALMGKQVEKDALLGKITPPVQGKPGRDVFGRVVEPKKEKNAVPKAGDNVTVTMDGHYVAQNAGTVRFVDNVISVQSLYVIEGDVDIKMGDIRYPGNILIRGNVRRGVSIRAGADIYVIGHIEQAKLVAGRNLTVGGGITGDGDCSVEMLGSVKTTYIQKMNIHAGGDVIAKNSIYNSNVTARGKVLVTQQKGHILAGRIHSLEGVEAKEIGSEYANPTEIVVGNDASQEEHKKVTAQIRSCRKRIENISKILEPVLKKVKDFSKLSSTQRKIIEKAIRERDELIFLKKELEARLEKIEEFRSACDNAYVKVFGVVHPGAAITIQGAVHNVKNDLSSVLFYLDDGHVTRKLINEEIGK